jgi:hypothetical protein
MSDGNYTIQDLGGNELARHYPDRGALPDADRYTSILQTDPEVNGFLGWLGSFKHCNSFWAVLSGNAEGLRVQVAADEFAIFIPWSEITASALRGSPATIVRLKTAALPSLDLVFHLDDEAADTLFQSVIPPLPRRDPPRRIAWWRDHPWLAVAALVIAVSVVLIVTVLLELI